MRSWDVNVSVSYRRGINRDAISLIDEFHIPSPYINKFSNTLDSRGLMEVAGGDGFPVEIDERCSIKTETNISYRTRS